MPLIRDPLGNLTTESARHKDKTGGGSVVADPRGTAGLALTAVNVDNTPVPFALYQIGKGILSGTGDVFGTLDHPIVNVSQTGLEQQNRWFTPSIPGNVLFTLPSRDSPNVVWEVFRIISIMYVSFPGSGTWTTPSVTIDWISRESDTPPLETEPTGIAESRLLMPTESTDTSTRFAEMYVHPKINSEIHVTWAGYASNPGGPTFPDPPVAGQMRFTNWVIVQRVHR